MFVNRISISSLFNLIEHKIYFSIPPKTETITLLSANAIHDDLKCCSFLAMKFSRENLDTVNYIAFVTALK